MNPAALKAIALDIVRAGAPSLPSIVLARDVPIFEVEFAGLEFADVTKLQAGEWAVLALARALGEVSAADVDAYLGLGDAVAEALLRRLSEECLLEPARRSPETPARPTESGLAAFFRRFLGKSSAIADAGSPARRTSAARRLYVSRASATPTYAMTAGGALAIDRGAVARRRILSARLLFLAQPLHHLGVVDERRQRHSQHTRPRPLEPQDVPVALRDLDDVLGLPPDERTAACGIGSHISGLSGELVGNVPGKQWEVRRAGPPGAGPEKQHVALLVLAGFPSSGPKEIYWRGYLRNRGGLADCPGLEPSRIMDPSLSSLRGLFDSLANEHRLPEIGALRPDGAFDLNGDVDELRPLLGETDRPHDAFLASAVSDWRVGIRVHPRPDRPAAARFIFHEFLHRREAELRRNFDETCAVVAAGLLDYWEHDPGLPSADELAAELWARPELRAALCMRRVRRDLVEPYAVEEDRP